MVKDQDHDASLSPAETDKSPEKYRSPTGITLQVVDGPHDGLVFVGSDTEIIFGREDGDTIELSLDPQISRPHCLIRFEADTDNRILQDLNSSNGTWYDNDRISTPQVLRTNTEFVIGTTVIRCRLDSEGSSFLPKSSRMEDSVRDLVGRLDTTASQGFGAARMLALQEKSPVLTDRHLFHGVISINADISFISHGKGLINTRFLKDRVSTNEYWTGAKDWIGQMVRIGNTRDSLFADQLATTPRVFRALTVAEKQAESFGNEVITSNNLLFGLLDDVDGRLRELFLAEGGDFKRLMAQLSRPPTRIGKRGGRSSVTRRITTDSSVLPRPAPSPKVIDPAIMELAASTLQAASKYHLASPVDRRTVLKETITGAIAEISADRRQESLEQLRVCFPVTKCAPISVISSGAADEVIRLKQRVEELETALSNANGVSMPPATPIPWSDVFNPDREFKPDLLAQEDAAALTVVHDLVGFGLAIENFVIGMVAWIVDQSITSLVSLPGFATTIRRTVNLSASGQPASDDFRPYLTAVENWLVATIAANHKAPEDWFAKYWSKTSPARIEAKVPAKILNDAKCWGHYKNVVRRISPDLVADEILALVRKNAQSQYDELIKRRS